MQTNIKTDGIGERLLDALTNTAGPAENPALMLQRMLNIGKDAAYRRLRGEVAFSVDELAVVCAEFGIGLDDIIYGEETGTAVFDLEEPPYDEPGREEQPCDAFVRTLETHAEIWKRKGGRFSAACPALPEFIAMRFPKISLFRMFADYSGLNAPFADFKAPERFAEVRLAYNTAFAGIGSVELILDENLLTPFIREIGYFERMGILSHPEADGLLHELDTVADILEYAAVSGHFPKTDNTTDIYLSHAGIGTEIQLLESGMGGGTMAWVSPYPGKSIRTQNRKICQNHRTCIDEIKRFATYISRSGEMARREFFAKIRKQLTNNN